MENAQSTIQEINERKPLFLTYNISRLRELLRYLPPKKLDMFHTIPFLLHTNLPGFPGYSKDPHAAYGIYKFSRSGFCRYAMKRHKIPEARLRAHLANRYDIHGVYLMGSSGTIGQTGHSDFDYWLLIDANGIGTQKIENLKKKLAEIEDWSREKYRHAVKFFLLDIDRLRNNDFAGMDTESSGSAQKTLLKEEFYRTFIMIAGHIPLWAVFPAGLSTAEYTAWVSRVDSYPSIAKDFVDLGNLETVHTGECLGALLWQIYKARSDPVKSFIKGTLITHYFFFGKTSEPLCDIVKKGFFERQLDSFRLDPYTLVFDTVTAFFDRIGDSDGSELIQVCVMLRLLGYPFGPDQQMNTPKRDLLDHFRSDWKITDKTLSRLAAYRRWSESEKQTFDDRLLRKLFALYELILRSQHPDTTAPPFEMTPSDLRQLADRISIWFQKKPGKLPRCSAWLRSKSPSLPLVVRCVEDRVAGKVWEVRDGTLAEKNRAALLYTAGELLRVIGWIYHNRLCDLSCLSVSVLPSTCGLSPIRTKNLLIEGYRFMHQAMPDSAKSGSWDKLLVMLKGKSVNGRRRLYAADLLIKNRWEEVYFRSIHLDSIENHLLQCYSTAVVMWEYIQKTPSHGLAYRIIEVHLDTQSGSAKTIDDLIDKFKKNGVPADVGGQIHHRPVRFRSDQPVESPLDG